MNRFGGEIRQLTDNATVDAVPSWSPDGKHLVFFSNRDGNNEIYRMRADGSGQTNLTNDPGADETATFSPDGKRIVFASNRDGDYDVYRMNANGSGVTQLTDAAGSDGFGVWSPDGRKIAFLSQRDDPAGGDVYVMNADGSNQLRLTDASGTDVSLDWLANPVARKLSLKASKTEVRKGGKVALSGKLSSIAPSCRAGQTVVLQARPASGGSFSKLATTTTSSAGAYKFSVKVKKSKTYRSSAPVLGRCKAAKSKKVTVLRK
jgi:tricorn protease-like protein